MTWTSFKGAAEDREHLLKDVEYDPIEEKVYFIDGVKKILRRCNIDGSQTEVGWIRTNF